VIVTVKKFYTADIWEGGYGRKLMLWHVGRYANAHLPTRALKILAFFAGLL